MKFDRCTSLTAAAAILLQLGTFVHAGPMFDEHTNAAAADDSCQGFQVTYPTDADVFEDASKHLIAWSTPPPSLQQLNISLANANQEPVAWIGLYEAAKGVSGEVPVALNGQQPGDYHFHLAGIGGPACQIDSATFQIIAPTDIKQATTNNIQQTENKDAHQNADYFTNKDERTHLDQATLDEIEQLASEQKQQHDNGGWFTNDDQRSSPQEHSDSLDSWSTEEVPLENPKMWHDDSADVVDHSNVGAWMAEELDPQHTDAIGFFVEEHNDDAAVVSHVDDYTNVGTWQAEEVSVSDDMAPAHDNAADDELGWVSGDGTASTLFDHTNVGSFIAEDITTDQDAAAAEPIPHEDLTGWQAEEIEALAQEYADSAHANVADAWVDESGGDGDVHSDATEWVAAEVDENGMGEYTHADELPEPEDHDDVAWHVDELPTSVPSWQEQGSADAPLKDHTDAAPFVAEEVHWDAAGDQQHANIADNWVDESDSQQQPHTNIADSWFDESDSQQQQPHANIADSWFDESDSQQQQQQQHANIADSWFDESSSQQHANDAAGKTSTGTMPGYVPAPAAPSDANTHNDAATISVLSPEALLAKW